MLNSLLLGSIGILFAGFLTLYLAKKSQGIVNILIFAFIVRAISVIIHTYLYPLPVGIHDAVRFEVAAWQLSELVNGSLSGFFNLYIDLINQEAPEGYKILRDLSWTYVPLYSAIYVLFDRSPLLLNSISLSIGMLTVYFGWLIALKVWNNRAAAKKSALVMAFFPPLIMYSSVILREIFIILFIQLFVLFFIRWSIEGRRQGLVISFFVALPHLILHNPMFLVLISTYLIPLLSSLKKIFRSIFVGRVNTRNAMKITLLISLVFFIEYLFGKLDFIKNAIDFIGNLSIPYVGVVKNFGLGNLVAYTQHTNYGNAAYPSFVVLRSTSDMITLLPLRMFYFLFSPFPWDVSSKSHLLGLVDSLWYFYLSYLFISHYKHVKENKKLKIVIFIFIVAVIFYSFGVGNFANAMRHRVKFLTLLVVIVAPFIFTRKINKKK